MSFFVGEVATGSERRRKRGTLGLLAVLALAGPLNAPAQDRGAAALAPLIRGLSVSARVLVIAAHPDDEDTQLITWLAKGRQVETAYLSLTRGDGGQNLVGNELGEPLGAIRTEELLAARRMDGGRQYFTRAFDFGFSKNAEETLTQWSKDSVLRDVVTVVRAFRPHVIVSGFSGTPSDGHGHHQVAGLLAREAYESSGDTIRFPRGATAGHGGWTVQKFYRGASFRMQDRATIRLNVGEYDPILGRSYAEIAAQSRSQHRSQGMGALQQRGARFDQLMREAARVGPEDAKAERSIMDGIDTTWARFAPVLRTAVRRAALDSLPAAFNDARARLDVLDPSGAIPALARVQGLLGRICGAASPDNPCAGLAPNGQDLTVRNPDLHGSLEVASSRVEQVLALATGVAVEATAPREVWALTEATPVSYAAYNRGRLPLHLTRRMVITPGGGVSTLPGEARTVLPDSSFRDSTRAAVHQVGQPWWLVRPRAGAMFAVAGSPNAESGERTSPVIVSFFEVGGGSFGVFTPVTLRYADAVRGEINSPVVGAPAIALTMEREVEYAPANAPIQRTVRVQVRSHAAGPRDVDVRLRLPAGLVADSAARHIRLPGNARAAAAGGVAAALGLTGGPAAEVVSTVTFNVRGRLPVGQHEITATATSNGQDFTTGYAAVAYDHIRTQRLYRPSTLGISAVDLQLPRGTTVAYLPGVGDNIAPVLQQLGLDVTVLDPANLAREDLSRFTSVVVGTRAYEAHAALVASNARLLDYARDGGTLVVQYGQYEMMTPGLMPYPITLARPADRVTVESAPVKILDPAARLLSVPNRITERDFDGWLQDRALYMPRTFDPAYKPVLEMNDPGEPPNRGGLLVAAYGRGTYVYTSLAFFRQLPNGVPGAARLFVNLLAARAERVAQ
ncbi:MAG: PIG-L family deacetylase [Gemmatimonadaceae bacterium]